MQTRARGAGKRQNKERRDMIEQRAKTTAAVVVAALAGGGVGAAASGQCQLTCPPGSSTESELCGDDTNGGCCCEDPPAFEPITCGETVCGTSWADGGFRDTDWYEIVTAEPMVLTLTVEAEFPVVIGLVETAPAGSGDCNDMTGYMDPYAIGEPCEAVSATTDELPAGTYWFWVSNNSFYDYPCDTSVDYVATLTCNGVPACPADFDDDGRVGIQDFLFLLGSWGGPDGDVDGDNTTDLIDFLLLLGAWGPCP
jgi:hypothetical protein